MVTEELFALVDFQSFQSQPQRVCLHAKFWLWIRKGRLPFRMYSHMYIIYIYIVVIIYFRQGELQSFLDGEVVSSTIRNNLVKCCCNLTQPHPKS